MIDKITVAYQRMSKREQMITLVIAAVSLLFVRRIRQPASTRRYRTRELPALVMRPIRRFSPELRSPGTNPRNASN